MIDQFVDRQAVNADLFELEDTTTSEKKQFRVRSMANITQPGTDLSAPVLNPILDEIRAKQNAIIATGMLKGRGAIHAYGVRIPGDGTSEPERLGDAAGLSFGAANGTAKAANDFDSLMPWAGMKKVNVDSAGRIVAREGDADFALDGSNGNVMTVVPKFWSKEIYDEDGSVELWIADGPQAGYRVDPFFCFGGQEYDYRLISTFPAKLSSDGAGLVSRSGGTAESGRTRAQFRALARATMPTASLDDIWSTSAVQRLLLVETANRNAQAAIGKGITELAYSNDDKATVSETGANRIIVSRATAEKFWVGENVGIGTSAGNTAVFANRTVTDITDYDADNQAILFGGDAVNITAGTHVVYGALQEDVWPDIGDNASGQPDGPMPEGQRPVVYRNLVNYTHGNLVRFKDGINRRTDTHVWTCDDPTQYADDLFDAPYRDSGILAPYTETYAKRFAPNTLGVLAPTASGGSATTGLCDYVNVATGDRTLTTGGGGRDAEKAGPFRWEMTHAANWTGGGAFFVAVPAAGEYATADQLEEQDGVTVTAATPGVDYATPEQVRNTAFYAAATLRTENMDDWSPYEYVKNSYDLTTFPVRVTPRVGTLATAYIGEAWSNSVAGRCGIRINGIPCGVILGPNGSVASYSANVDVGAHLLAYNGTDWLLVY